MTVHSIRSTPLAAGCVAMCLTASVWAAENPPTSAAGLGFDSGSIAEFSRQERARNRDPLRLDKVQLRKRDFLYGFANRFRLLAAVDPTRLQGLFAPRNDAALAELVGTKAFRDAPGIWRYFFRSSLIHVGLLRSPVVRVGFYNPLVDGWVLTDWSWQAGRIQLASAHVISGEALRGDDETGAARASWITRNRGSLVDLLRETTALSGFAFARAYPMLGDTPLRQWSPSRAARLSRAVVEARLVGVLANLNQHYHSAPMTSLSDNLIKAVASGDPASLATLTTSVGSQTRHRIVGLPSPIRKNLELTGRFPTTSGAVWTFGMPMMSRWMMIAHYRAADGEGGGKIDGIAFFEVTPTAGEYEEPANASN